MGKKTMLPKNIRQIGDIQGREKICMEDYVMTYIHKMEPREEKGFLGIFLGERQETEDTDYTFIRGILEIAQEEEEEKLKERFEKERTAYFPDWKAVGCCVIGAYPTKRLELLNTIAPEAAGMIYHLQEQEENIYLKEQGSYRRIKGYLVFYEQNREMQDYMAAIFGKDSVEKESLPDKAIKRFREKVEEKGEQKARSILKLASSFFVVVVLAIGAIAVNRIDEIRAAITGSGQDGAASEDTANTAARYTAGSAASAGETSAWGADTAQSEAETETGPDESSSWLTGSDSFWADTYEDDPEAETEAANTIAGSNTEDSGEAASESESSETVSRKVQAAYVIKSGDTLASICRKYYGSLERLEELCEANDITDADLILPGQKIVLP